MTGRHISLALGTAVTLLVPGASLAASPSPSTIPSAIPSAAPSARDGWTPVTNNEPAFSVQLPPGWTQGATTSGVAAISTSGETLSVTPEALPPEPDFDAWVTRVETDLETAAKVNLLTVFRQVGPGLVARIDEGMTERDAPGEVTSRFLFPLCRDGSLSMDISGPPPAATEDGQPDAWDSIASGVNPCAVDPAPERVLDPELIAAGPRYLAILGPANAAIGKAYEPLTTDTTLKVWHKQAAKIAKIIKQLVADLQAEPWPASVQPLVDVLIAADQDAATLYGETFAKAKNAKGITSHYDDLDTVNAATRAAGRDLRLALGLPTAPR